MAQPAPAAAPPAAQQQGGHGPAAPGTLTEANGFRWGEAVMRKAVRPPRVYSSIVSATAGRVSRSMFEAALDGRRKKVIQNSSLRVAVPGVDIWSYEALVHLWFRRAKRQPPRNMAQEQHRQNWAYLRCHFWKCDKNHLSAVFHQQRYAPLNYQCLLVVPACS